MPKKGEREESDLPNAIGGTLSLFGLNLDLGKLFSSPEDATSQLEGLRQRLKDLGGRETISDDGWRSGGTSVSGYVRVRNLAGEEEYHIGTSAGRKPGGRPARTAEPPDVVEPSLDIFDEADDVTVIADVPGVDLEDLDISIRGRSLHISTKPSARRGYAKDIGLNTDVDPESLQSSCRNGVLEIRLSKDVKGE